MKIHGACHCGAIEYEAEIDPASVGICHCTDCQVLSGSPYRVIVLTPVASYVAKKGAPKIYIKTAESGRKRIQSFCEHCGTPIYAAPVEAATHYFLRMGAIRERADLKPKRQIWCRSALPWVMDIQGLEKRDGQ